MVQWSENNVLIPIIMNQALWISPLLIFVYVDMMKFFMIYMSSVNIPLAVIIKLVFEDMFRDITPITKK